MPLHLNTNGDQLGFSAFYNFQNSILILTRDEPGVVHTYAISEISSVLEWLKRAFNDQWFPLANNVAHLGQGNAQPGLGRAIIETDNNHNVAHAQGASYLGVLLQALMILEWNNINHGIQWRLGSPISEWLFNDDGSVNMAVLKAIFFSHRDLVLY